MIGTEALSLYLSAAEKTARFRPGHVFDTLPTDCITPASLRNDDLQAPNADRGESFFQRGKVATGKYIARETPLFPPGSVVEACDEWPANLDAEEPPEESTA